MPIVEANFKAPWWLSGPHAQTIWSTLTGRYPTLSLRRERFELADGDFIDLDWLEGGSGPLVFVMHGLEGSIDSPYARGLLQEVSRMGWRGVLMHFRGCSGEVNRLNRAYHSGDTGDVAEVVGALKRREPDVPIFGVGYSLGGNVLLKWLGETGGNNPLRGGVAVSVPFDLDTCATRLDQGLSRIYQGRFVKGLKEKYTRKAPLGDLKAIRSLREWDDQVTAGLHGFTGAEDYYTRSSSRPFLKRIEVPTLVLHAVDDPFMTPAVIPTEADLSPHVTLELSPKGGHVGFVYGSIFRPEYWLEERIPTFLRSMTT